MRCIVVGASGFVGSAVVRELEANGHHVVRVRAPRLRTEARNTEAVLEQAIAATIAGLAGLRSSAPMIIVNAAGLADPGSTDASSLFGANALLPAVLAAACGDGHRMVHLSSAAVLGTAPILDARRATAPLTAYGRSKAVGEDAFLRVPSSVRSRVVIRASSVQGPDRPTTRALGRLARHPLLVMPSRADAPSPVTTVSGLARFVRFVVEHEEELPDIVMQPDEGHTVGSVVAAAGGHPFRLPNGFLRAVLGSARRAAVHDDRFLARVRRLDVLWFGQRTEAHWSRSTGFAPTPRAELGRVFRAAGGGRAE